MFNNIEWNVQIVCRCWADGDVWFVGGKRWQVIVSPGAPTPPSSVLGHLGTNSDDNPSLETTEVRAWWDPVHYAQLSILFKTIRAVKKVNKANETQQMKTRENGKGDFELTHHKMGRLVSWPSPGCPSSPSSGVQWGTTWSCPKSFWCPTGGGSGLLEKEPVVCRREDGGLRRVKKGREEPVGDEMVSLKGSPCNAPQPESISWW